MQAKDCEGYQEGVENLKDCLLTKFYSLGQDNFDEIEKIIKAVTKDLITINKETYKRLSKSVS